MDILAYEEKNMKTGKKVTITTEAYEELLHDWDHDGLPISRYCDLIRFHADDNEVLFEYRPLSQKTDETKQSSLLNSEHRLNNKE